MSMAYAGPVIDPHHHLWDLSLGKHPWLTPREETGGEKAFGSIEPIRRDYGVEAYLRDTQGQNIVATVHIEAGWSDDDPLGETRWLDGQDRSSGVALRYVARVPLASPEASHLLEMEASNPAVIGIRDIVSWHPDPAQSFARTDGMMSREDWRAGLAKAGKLGLVFDLMLFPWQMDEACRLAADFADIQFVLNHCGSPVDRTPEGMAAWRKGLKQLAVAPNVAIKISDPVAYDHDWTVDSLAAVIMPCIEFFGSERAMFASDFPVAGLHADFTSLYGAFREIACRLTLDEQQALFFDTANRIYRLGLSAPGTEGDSAHV
jgi:predicted TIM-barrel fold metal-dependent hydrolase